MTMYKYNPSQPDKSDNIEAVRDAAQGYLPNELVIDEGVFVGSEELKKIGRWLEACRDTDDYWRSFNDSKNDYHIVPGKSSCDTQNSDSKSPVALYRETAKAKIGKASGCGNIEWTYVHCAGYTEVAIGEYKYLCSLNRLVVNDDKKQPTVSNHIGRIQLYRYRAESTLRNGNKPVEEEDVVNIDIDGHFKLMYPKSAENGDCESDEATGHCVYNAPLTISSSTTDIAREFRRFIGLWEHADFIRSLKHSSGSCEDILNAVEQDELLKAIVCWEFKVQSHQ